MTRRATLLLAFAILSSAGFVDCSNSNNGGNQGGNTAPTFTSAKSTSFTIGTSGSFLVTVTGTPMPTITESGALPNGVTFTDKGNGTATLSGTPAAGTAGTYRITITATNGVGTPANQNFTLTVGQSPTIASSNGVTFTVGSAGSFTVTTTGTPTPSITESGALPTGVTFKDNGNGTATLSGTPAAGTGKKYTLAITASNGAGSPANQTFTLTVNQTPAIASASSTTFTVGSAGSFTVTTTGFPTPSIGESGALPSGVNFKDNGNGTGTLSGTPAAGTAGNYPLMFTPSNGVGSPASQNFALTVNTTAPPSTVNVLTYHNDNARTGLNPNETLLTTSNVNSTKFGKIGTISVDGLVDAAPLYVGGLTINGAKHNVLYVVTEHDSVYAFDADSLVQLWKTSLLGSGELPSDNRNCDQVTPEIGITSMPVIDPTPASGRPNGAIFIVAMSKNSAGTSYFQRLHALDLTTGAELGTPTTITASVNGTATGSSGGTVTFDPKQYKERAALLLLNGVIYTTWASHCDNPNYYGWVIGFNESTRAQVTLNITPNGNTQNGKEAGIWMSGAGPAADSLGNIYFLAGNGTFDTSLNSSNSPVNSDYGNSFLKLSTSGNSLGVADYFAMHDTVSESNNDIDLGSGGALVLPDSINGSGKNLAVGAGKDGRIYVVNRDPGMMGKFNSNNDTAIYQELNGALSGGMWAAPAYFNNTVFFGPVGNNLLGFPVSNARLTSPFSTSTTFAYPGTTPSISADGSTSPPSNGIVWAVENRGGNGGGGPGVLHAYDAATLVELYNSTQTSDSFTDNKFVTPMIANGKVYIPSGSGVVVFGTH